MLWPQFILLASSLLGTESGGKKKKKDTPGALCMFIQDLRTLTLCKQEDVPCWAVDREAQEKSLSFTSFLPKQVDHKKISKTIEKP